jgi:hypothetical protein
MLRLKDNLWSSRLFFVATIICIAAPVFAADIQIEKILPAKECADGWVMEEKVKLYNKDTLFDRINGEAELYFTYGFEALASARYVSPKNPEHSVEADVYKMGSLLDAFGIYASYRRAEDETANSGAEGSVSPSLLLFYQGRYFVRLQASGTLNIDKNIFLSCAGAISRNIPEGRLRPRELEAFAIPSVVKGSERYIAKSLLGYDFLKRGLMADIMLGAVQSQVFVVPEDSAVSARRVFEQYLTYLKVPGSAIQKENDYIYISAADPLYGKALIAQTGRHVFGLIRLGNALEAKSVLDDLGKKLRD